MLYSRTLLFIHPLYYSSHLVTLTSHSNPLSGPPLDLYVSVSVIKWKVRSTGSRGNGVCRYNMSYNINWIFSFHHMSSPHVYSRYRCWHTSIYIITIVTAIPTGVEVFSWLAICHRGNIKWSPTIINPRFNLPFYSRWTNRNGPSQFITRLLHDRHYVIAHFHVLWVGTVFAVTGGFVHWFPLSSGYMYTLNLTRGKVHFVIISVDMNIPWFPQHLPGLSGIPRR